MAETPTKLKRGELAEATGINSETLRFYEKAGLLKPERGANGYRLYGEDDAKRIRLTQRAVGVGFSIQDVKSWLEDDAPGIERALILIDAKAEEIDKLRKSLRKRLKKI